MITMESLNYSVITAMQGCIPQIERGKRLILGVIANHIYDNPELKNPGWTFQNFPDEAAILLRIH